MLHVFRRPSNIAMVSLSSLALLLALIAPPARAGVVLNPGDILMTDANNFAGLGSLYHLNPTTGARTLITSTGLFVEPIEVIVESPTSVIVVDATSNAGGRGALVRVDTTTGGQQLISRDGLFRDLWGGTIGADGALYAANPNAAHIVRVDAVTGAQSNFSGFGLLQNPWDVERLPNGDLLVLDSAATRVVVVDGRTGQQRQLTSGGLLNVPRAAAVGPDGRIVVLNYGEFGSQASLVAIDLITGAQSYLAFGRPGAFTSPRDVAFAADGDLLVTDHAPAGGRPLRFDSLTGARTVLASGGELADPFGLAVVPNPSAPPPQPVPLPAAIWGGVVAAAVALRKPFRRRAH